MAAQQEGRFRLLGREFHKPTFLGGVLQIPTTVKDAAIAVAEAETEKSHEANKWERDRKFYPEDVWEEFSLGLEESSNDSIRRAPEAMRFFANSIAHGIFENPYSWKPAVALVATSEDNGDREVSIIFERKEYPIHQEPHVTRDVVNTAAFIKPGVTRQAPFWPAFGVTTLNDGLLDTYLPGTNLGCIDALVFPCVVPDSSYFKDGVVAVNASIGNLSTTLEKIQDHLPFLRDELAETRRYELAVLSGETDALWTQKSSNYLERIENSVKIYEKWLGILQNRIVPDPLPFFPKATTS